MWPQKMHSKTTKIIAELRHWDLSANAINTIAEEANILAQSTLPSELEFWIFQGHNFRHPYTCSKEAKGSVIAWTRIIVWRRCLSRKLGRGDITWEDAGAFISRRFQQMRTYLLRWTEEMRTSLHQELMLTSGWIPASNSVVSGCRVESKISLLSHSFLESFISALRVKV